jgi:trk system potassium uptake protein TrkH
MNFRGVLFLLGRLLLTLAAALLVPAALALYLGGEQLREFLIASAVTAIAGVLLAWFFRQQADFRFGRREAFVLVTCAWVTASLAGATPYVLIKGWSFAVNGLFESASGFTTTGASVLSNLEAEAAPLMLWRSLTQWLGGMGIIVLGIAILPRLSVGGMQLLGAEAPGPTTEKLTPRVAQTAKALWGIYFLLTGAEALVLMLFGMGWLEAINHAMTTMATGGFSTRSASVGAYSGAIQVVITLFMVLAGVNFALHFKCLRGKPLAAIRDPEFRLYIWILTAATLFLTLDLVRAGRGLGTALRLAAFQATTVVTTTGFATEDFDLWPNFSRALLFTLMFVGGCAGSTSGSIKVVRIMILGKRVLKDLKQMVLPRAVLPVLVGNRAISVDVVASVMTFVMLFLMIYAAGGLLLGAMGYDLVTSFSASATCLGNIGPGFELVGPARNFDFFPPAAKLLLVALMLVGRLELYTVLVLIFLSRRLL